MPHNSLPQSFINKKNKILASLSTVKTSDYGDNSPKGSVDAEIIDLIAEINAVDGYVTTSSCAGRVSVFVEGVKANLHDEETPPSTNGITSQPQPGEKVGPGAGPGGKGHGNRWLLVSHEPLNLDAADTKYHELCRLQPADVSSVQFSNVRTLRLVKLSFSPLILHVLCATLQHAKPLLAAAINAGFRESGVQSLKALDDGDAGVMVGIRTAGLSFETVIGWVEEPAEGEEVYRSIGADNVLAMFLGVANERFEWNRLRRERLRVEFLAMTRHGRRVEDWEDEHVRRIRKREEGKRRQQQLRERGTAETREEQDTLQDGLGVELG